MDTISDNGGVNDFMFGSNPDACPVCDRDERECACAPDEIVLPARWEKTALSEIDAVRAEAA